MKYLQLFENFANTGKTKCYYYNDLLLITPNTMWFPQELNILYIIEYSTMKTIIGEKLEELKIQIAKEYKGNMKMDIRKHDEFDFDVYQQKLYDDQIKMNKGLIAPNGKISKLPEDLYKLVRTSEFKNWFGDWEKQPNKSSKVIDENGEPMIVYHGSSSSKKISKFDNISNFSDRIGIYTTHSRSVAKHYTKYRTDKYTKLDQITITSDKGGIYPLFINLRKPFVMDAKECASWLSIKVPKKWRKYTYDDTCDTDGINELANKSGKYDGVIMYNVGEEGGISNNYVAFSSSQLKIANGINKKFSRNSDDIHE